MKIGLVTEEIAVGSGSGGIGGAFHELALLLAQAGHGVELIYAPVSSIQACPTAVATYYRRFGINVTPLPISDYVWDTSSAEARAYAVFCLLKSYAEAFDVVHFHDYKGLGFYCVNAKAQRVAFARTTLVVQAHGPTRWTLQTNGHPFTHEDQLKIDFLERGSVARADRLVSPSRYLLGWFKDQGWATPPENRVSVIQNACLALCATHVIPMPTVLSRPDEIVLFARHEGRKGVMQFCDALDELSFELAAAAVQVTFLGPLGSLNDEPSLVYLSHRARNWAFPIAVLPDLGRTEAARYLVSNPRSLVVVPSPVENSPYTVLEAISLGKPLLTSSEGGASELFDDQSARLMTCQITGPHLAGAIRRVLREGCPPPRLACSLEQTRRNWLGLHKTRRAAPPVMARRQLPKVTAAITHHERPEKLYDALLSLARQTYTNVDIVIVDDGSKSEGTLRSLERMEPLIRKLGARLIRRDNGYLGAARNTAARESKSDYLLFLDDDDIAFPTMIATLVEAAEATRADIMGCLNLFMEVDRRAEAHLFPDMFAQKPSYIPLGGPLAFAPLANVFGSATCLIRRSVFDAVGGYTEQHGVGHEDFEFYVRALQHGAKLEVCPVPLFLYEVGRPSMSSATSKMKNWRRVAGSVKVDAQPDAWADLAMLNAGQRAAEHTENFRIYFRSLNQQGELLNELDAMAPSSADYALKAAALARQVGAASFGRALLALGRRRSLASAEAGGVEDTVEDAILLPVQTAPHLVCDQHIVAALVELQLGRLDEAYGSFRLSIERARALTLEHQRLLSILIEESNFTRDEIRPFIEALARLTRLDVSSLRLGPIVFRLALRAGLLPFARRIAVQALAIDTGQYLDRYGDVASVVNGDAQASLHHYVNFGASEGRAGYELSRLLVAVLWEDLAVKASLEELADAVQVLPETALSVPQPNWTEGDRLAAD